MKDMMKKISAIMSKAGISREEILRLLKFAVIGVSNTLVDYLVFFLLNNILLTGYGVNQAISYTCGMLNSFVLNRRWTFSDFRRNRKLPEQFLLFMAINGISLAVTVGAMAMLAYTLGMNVYIAKALVILIAQAINFLGYRLWVFRKPSGT